MNINETKKLLSREMKKHVALEEWVGFFGERELAIGVTWKDRKKIEISKLFCAINETPIITHVIRHEIAHALCPSEENHGEIFFEKCVQVGCYPSEFVPKDVFPKAKFIREATSIFEVKLEQQTMVYRSPTFGDIFYWMGRCSFEIGSLFDDVLTKHPIEINYTSDKILKGVQ